MTGLNLSNTGFVGSLIGLAPARPPAVAYISPYPTANLYQYSDVNFGASGVVLNSSGHVTQWTNKVSGGAHFLPTGAGPTYLNNVDGFPALNTAGGDMSAALSFTHKQPLTITILIKVAVNPASISYQGVAAMGAMQLLVKFTTGLLVQSSGANSTGPDIPASTWVPITVSYNGSLSIIQVDRAVVYPGSIVDSTYNTIGWAGQETYMRLLLAYDRAFSLSDIANLHAQIRAAYNLP